MAMTSFHPIAEKKTDLRIVLLGKTGVGKSAAGNTILGRRAFHSTLSFSSVRVGCRRESTNFGGLYLDVIDTPGLFDTERGNEEVIQEIARCISMAAPGPHVFLIVLQTTRFTAEERKTLEIIQTMFGEEAAKYTMVLFTHGDDLREENMTMENLLETSQPLRCFISQCSILQTFEDKYHVFDNKAEDPGQVSGLVQKINRLVHRNGGRCYTNMMFEEAQRANQEEMKRLLRENPGINPEDARRQAERDNSFIRAVLKAAAAGAGLGALGVVLKAAATGAAIGATGGAVGVAVGGSAGAVAGAALAVKAKGGCVIQ